MSEQAGVRLWDGEEPLAQPGPAAWPHRIACELLNRPWHEAAPRVVGRVADLADADRTWILEYGPDLAVFRNTHEWCRAGVSSHLDDLQGTPVTLMGEMHRHMVAGRPVMVTDVRAMPHSMRSLQLEFLRQSIRSCLTVPVHYDGRLRGAIGFDMTREERDWGEDVVSAMLSIAELIGVACFGDNRKAPAGGGTEFPPLVYLRTARSARGVPLEALAMLRADADQSVAYLTDGSMVVDVRPLKWWQGVLPSARFIRIHRSAIVQIRCITALTRCKNGGWQIRLDGSEDTPSVSRKALPELRSRLGL